MRRIILWAGLLWSAAAFAQNLNPTVEVTNIYAREASGIEKPSQLLAIPDSLTRFNLDFDYAVTQMPYQGAYEFTPYLVEPRPSARLSSEKKLLLRLGAGYSLHPELAAVWTPVRTQKFRLNLFADHTSFWGSYHNIGLSASEFVPEGSFRSGHEMRTNLGIDALLNWSSGIFRADVGYNNVGATDVTQGDFQNHVLRGALRVQNVPGTTKVDYEVGSRVAAIWAPVGFQELHTVTDAGFRAGWFKLGLQGETITQPDGTVASFHVMPHFVRSGKRFSYVLGVKAAFMLRSDQAFVPTREGYIFPDVQASLVVVPDYFTMYLAVTGGNELMSYDSYLQKDSFIAGADWYTDVKIEPVRAVLGFRGNFGRRFYYDLKGGYSWIENMWLWAYNPGNYNPSISYAGPVHTAFGMLDAGWKNHFLEIEGHFKYVYTLNKPENRTPGVVPFTPAAFSGSGKVMYNWGGRIRAGVTLEGRSLLHSPLGDLPGYLDLGLQGGFQFSSQLGLWLKAGNLLNQPVQRVPFYAQKGIYITAGITYNL